MQPACSADQIVLMCLKHYTTTCCMMIQSLYKVSAREQLLRVVYRTWRWRNRICEVRHMQEGCAKRGSSAGHRARMTTPASYVALATQACHRSAGIPGSAVAVTGIRSGFAADNSGANRARALACVAWSYSLESRVLRLPDCCNRRGSTVAGPSGGASCRRSLRPPSGLPNHPSSSPDTWAESPYSGRQCLWARSSQPRDDTINSGGAATRI